MAQHLWRGFLTARTCEVCLTDAVRGGRWAGLPRSARSVPVIPTTGAGGERGPDRTHPLGRPSACWRTHDPLVPGRWRGATSQGTRVPLQAAGEQPAAAKTQAGVQCLTRPNLPCRSC
jgi:hypothetical protein